MTNGLMVEDTFRVLAIDPGRSTGIVLVDQTGLILQSQLATTPEQVLVAVATITPSVVVIEDFVGAGPRTLDAIFTLKLIGGASAIAWLKRIQVVIQVPQARTPLLTEAKRRADKGTSIHVVDAYAHALAFLERWQASVNAASQRNLPVSPGGREAPGEAERVPAPGEV